MTRPTLVLLSRRGHASVERRCMAHLEQRTDLTVVQRDRAPDRPQAVELLAGADFLGATNVCLPHIDGPLLDELPRLRGIVLYASGYDHIDVELLRSRDVGLSIVSGYATAAVAEHCIAMVLALATRLHLANDRSRGLSPDTVSLRGMELAGKTLGVIGVGRIGRHVAGLARSLGMGVLGTDIDPFAVERGWDAGARMCELEWLLESSDVVTLCASHRYGAPPILGADELATMRPGALLVNVGRPALVDTGVALSAVRAGHLRGYGVDDNVVDPSRDGDLLIEGRVIQTGHSAWWRDEVLDRGARMWGDRLLAAVEGRPIDVVTWPGIEAMPLGKATIPRART